MKPMQHDHEHRHGTGARPTFGVHGMLVLGGQPSDQTLSRPAYVSHLPMFMAPHDFQVIMRVGGDAARAFDAHVAHSGSDPFYTFVPKPFSIVELDPARPGGAARTSFKGDLFRGHFERHGDKIATGHTFEVEQVVHFRRLRAKAGHCEQRYLVFGERDAAHMAHLVCAPPDFDQILDIEIGSLSGVSDGELRAGLLLTVPGREAGADGRLRAGESFSGAVHAEGTSSKGAIELAVSSEYYIETADLAAAM